MDVCSVIALQCKHCSNTQHFGEFQGGYLNKTNVIRGVYVSALRHLWYVTRNLKTVICPACVEKRKPRKTKIHVAINKKLKKVKSIPGGEYTMRPTQSSPILSLLWSNKVNVYAVEWNASGLVIVSESAHRVAETGDDAHMVTRWFSVARGELIDPMMHEQALHLDGHKEILHFVQELIEDQREYIRLMTSGKIASSTGHNVEVFIRNKGGTE